ncbi:SpaA isopeptide-forming pilin-related protein (plasmid) [Clostridium perfringens]|uniref:SpaA isopeptide-forming pilin-related protein n=3 Tax=Clostridium perfringens TaxID=1502 RepID=UPI002ED5011B|nr:SpaA isopeptide-forming pilin-related protein [Clostridium perfringens]
MSRKRNKLTSFLMIFAIVFSLFPTNMVHAEENIQIDSYWIDGQFIAINGAKNAHGETIKVELPDGSTIPFVTIAKITKGGKALYCLEPHKAVDANNIANYVSNDMNTNTLGFSDQQKTDLILYSYYGYGNKEQANPLDNRLYLATQLLIWERLGISGLDKLYIGKDGVVNRSIELETVVSAMKQDIINKVEAHKNILGYTPSFRYNNSNIKGTVKIKRADLINGITITEKGGRLSDLAKGGITSSDNKLKIDIKDNSLNIMADSDIDNGTKEIVLNYVNPNEVNQAYILTMDKSQTLGDFSITDKQQKSTKIILEIYADTFPVKFSKQDITGTELKGAEIQLQKKDKTVLQTWTSDGTNKEFQLEAGEYIFHEVSAPEGYKVATDIHFTVGTDGTITATGSEVHGDDKNLIVMVDDYSSRDVVISKIKLGGEELPGARINILNEKKEIVEQWTSTNKPTTIKLEPGTYTFHEVSAPEGYLAVTDITFTVDKDGKVKVTKQSQDDIVTATDNKLTVTDKAKPADTFPVKFSKQDITGTELKGAEIQLQKKDKTVLQTWTSDGTNKEFQLEAGEYIFHEVSAPEGYKVATDIHFTVGTDGTITATGSEVHGDDKNLIVMVDDYSSRDVVISKIKLGGEELPGARINILNEKKEIVEQWTSTNKPTTIKLEPGTYTFHEVSAPEGYLAVTDITFTVDKDGKVKVTKQSQDDIVTATDNKLTVTDKAKPADTFPVKFSKQDITGTELKGAEIQLQKKDKTVLQTWTSDGTNKEFQLEAGEYIFHEVSAPEGYKVATDIHFTVGTDGTITATGSEVHGDDKNLIVMVDDYSSRDVVISKIKLGGEELPGARINILNEKKEIVEQWTSTNKPTTIKLEPGTYTFHEVSAPEGYLAVTDITFTVDKDGKVKVTKQSQDDIVTATDNKLTVTDKAKPADTFPVKFSKQDITGTELKGAEIQLQKKDKTVLQTWTSDGTNKEFQLEAGEYIFHEVSAPEGYKVATDIHFTVGTDGTITATGSEVHGDDKNLIVMVDDYSSRDVVISKIKLGGEELPGARINILNEKKEIVEQWTSTNKPTTIKLEPGTYTFHEVSAPEGYLAVTDITFTVDKDGKVKVTKQSQDDIVTATDNKLTVTDKAKPADTFPVKFSKQDITGTELKGAEIQLQKKDKTVLQTWTSDGTNKEFQLEAGEYIFHEVSAPEGYKVATDIHFTVGTDGTITATGSEVHGDDKNLIVMVDDYSSRDVVISKIKLGGEELPGARINILNEKKEIVEQWTSTNKPTTIKLEPGTYTFHEVSAPEGYLAVTDITFTVDKDGKVKVTKQSQDDIVTATDNKLTVTDKAKPADTFPVKFSKQDITGTELKGAEIQLQKKDKTVLQTWTSDGTNKEFQLEAGEYIFHEVSAPEGYKVATDIHFTVGTDGTITATGSEVHGDDKNLIVMVDDYSSRDVVISKIKLGGEELPGARINILNEKKEIVEQWTSTNKPTTIKLEPGTYTFHEVSAPEGYLAVTDITFTVDKDGKVKVTKQSQDDIVTATDNKLTVTDKAKPADTFPVKFSKQDITGTELKGAEIQLQKKDKTVLQTWTSDGTNKEFQLEAGEYIFHEVSAPEGYKVATDIHFTVGTDGTITATGSEVHGDDKNLIVMVDDYSSRDVVISKIKLGGEELPGARINILNEKKEIVEQWTSTNKPTTIKLEPGTYTFHEVSAPEGYLAVTDITFTVDKDGKVKVTKQSQDDIVTATDNKLTVTDKAKPADTFPVKFSKQDITGTELKGAEIQLQKKDKTVLQTWTSDGTNKEFQLEAGEYIFHEVSAPEGYKVATDIHFTVGTDGTITATGSEVHGDDKNLIVMVDDYSSRDVVISKIKLGGEELPGARINILNEKKEIVEQWTSTNKPTTIKLEPGTYTFHEVSAPEGYLAVTDITFTVDKDGKVKVTKQSQDDIVTATDNKLTVTDKAKPADTNPTKTNKIKSDLQKTLPKTGDTSEAGVFCGLLVSLGAFLALFKKKRS